jgi:hypothetical protein
MAGQTGLEPATSGVTGQHSNRLSYYPNEVMRSKETILYQSKEHLVNIFINA